MPDQPPGVEAAPPSATTAPPPAAQQTLRILPRLSLIAVTFIVAVVGSYQFRSHLSPGADTPEDHSLEKPKDRIKTANPAIVLARGDNGLRQHRFEEAISHYHELLEGGATDSAAMNYRLGLCNEFLGQTEKAVASYRLAIVAAKSTPLTFASQLGMTRCLLRQNRPAEARRLLQAPLLDDTRQQGVAQALINDAYYLIALALARESAAAAPALRPQNQMAVFTLAPLDIPMYLDDVDAEPEPRTKPAAAEQERVVVQPRVGADPATVFFAERNAASALDLIDQLATEGGLKIEWTAEAKKALLHRSLQLHLHDWELRDVLDHTCDFLDLVCELDVDCVRISMAAKADPKLLSAFRRGIAQRALFAALRVDPEHSHAAASLLELGNVEAAQNRWNEAVFWYNRVALDHGLSPHAVAAHFNTGQAHLNRRDPARARKALFRVVDQSPGHELALLAGIQIGQLCLQENDALQAIVHLRRAQQYAISSPHQPTATLMLAAAQLHAEDCDAARRTLAQNRPALERDPYQKTAAFIDTYARYRLALENPEGNPNKRESNELVATLWRNKDETLLGAYGHWLVAKAYGDIGFWDQAERLLRRALPEAQAPFNASVEVTLAETLLKKNRRADAMKLLEKWTETESPFRARSRLQLARLEFEEKNYSACAAWCHKIWTAREFTDQPELLLLWGSALEGRGELAKAAQCFAGKAPE